jgi:dTDP-4-amino-4,6-dideoxygalactose transaminase
VSLPLFATMTTTQQDQVVEAVHSALAVSIA